MTLTGSDWPTRAARLADDLAAGGWLSDPAWRAAFAAVPRHVFVPLVIDDGRVLAADDEHQRDAWLDAVYADEALLTQTADTSGIGAQSRPTSSSSRPRVMAVMLERLDVADGMRVLEIGTGTGSTPPC